MKKISNYLIGLLAIICFIGTSCKKEGCTDSVASNYDSDAKTDDGSCEYYYGGKDYGQIDVGAEVNLSNEFDIYIDDSYVGRITQYFPSGFSCGNPNAVGGIYQSGSHLVRAVGNGGSPVIQSTITLSSQECKVVLIENLGGGGGNCNYNQYSGTDNCDPGYDPVSSTTCCPENAPYYCSASNSCYNTCEAADAACSSTVIKADASGSGGSSGYNCSSGSCTYVSSGADYSSLSACQSACSGNNCNSMNSYVVVTDASFTNQCGNSNDFTVTVKNNSNQSLSIQIALERTNGDWDCGIVNPAAGSTGTYWICQGSGQYSIRSMLYSDWVSNCNFGICP